MGYVVITDGRPHFIWEYGDKTARTDIGRHVEWTNGHTERSWAVEAY